MRPATTTGIVLGGIVLFIVAARLLMPLANDHAAGDALPRHVAEEAAAPSASDVQRNGRSRGTAEPAPRSGVRRVAPGIAAVSPYQSRGLQRDAPDRVPEQEKEPEAQHVTRLFRPVATAGGRLEAGGYRIEIADIRMVEPDRMCGAEDATWPCGMYARTAFRAWLRGRAVMCDFDPASATKKITARCRVGGQDSGEWLVENGWAQATAGGPYEEVGKRARQAAVGIFARR